MDNTYGLGGTEVQSGASEAIQEIPQNRTLLVEKLTNDQPVKPVVVGGLTTVEDVFEHFNPQVEVDFENNDGVNSKETLKFKNSGDFGAAGITRQSNFLKNLHTEKDQYVKIIKQLKTNKILKAALTDPDAKLALMESLRALISEIEAEK